MSAFWNHLNPKIRAALLAAIAVAGVTILNDIVSVYGDRWWIPIVSALLPVIAGYQASAKPK